MKIFSLTVSASLLFTSPFCLAESEEGAPAKVVEEVSEEAAILRALVEEYKAKAAAGQTAPAPAKPAVAAAEEEKRPEISPLYDDPNATPKGAAVKMEASTPAGPPAFPKLDGEEGKIEIPAIPKPQMVDTKSLSSLAEEMKQVVKPAPPTEKIAAPEVPSIDTVISTPSAPSAPEVVEDMAKTGGEAISSVESLISNPIESVESVISETKDNIPAPETMAEKTPGLDSVVISDAKPSIPKMETPLVDRSAIPPLEEMPAIPEAPKVEEAPQVAAVTEVKDAPEVAAPAMPSPPSSDSIILRDDPPSSTSIVLRDDPPAKVEMKKVEVPAITAIEEKVEIAVNGKVEEAAEKAEALEGAAMKAAESAPEVLDAAPEEVTKVVKADEMKKGPEPAPEVTKKSTPQKASSGSDSQKPLVIANKRPAPKKEEGEATSTEEVMVAENEAAPAVGNGSSPAATARSVTPLKDLGRMLFGPKDAPRGPIFKRKSKGTSSASAQ